VELEQVLDALELHDEADWLPRVLARYGLAMDAVARGIAFGQLWQQMLFREFEAAAAAGLRVHSGAKRGGATRAAFTEVEREAIRASYSQMLREDRGATESQETLAAQYGVNPKTIQRIVNA
jgi:hypothetical protein